MLLVLETDCEMWHLETLHGAGRGHGQLTWGLAMTSSLGVELLWNFSHLTAVSSPEVWWKSSKEEGEGWGRKPTEPSRSGGRKRSGAKAAKEWCATEMKGV